MAYVSSSLITWLIVLIVSSGINTSSFPLPVFINIGHHTARRSTDTAIQSPRKRTSTIMSNSAGVDSESSSQAATNRIVLIGGGHAHVQVIKALNVHSRPANLHVTLIDLQSSAFYSGMVPGCVSKLYTLDQVQIALDSLADWAGIEFVRGKVVGMSFEEQLDNGGKKTLLVEEIDDKRNGNVDVVKKVIPFDVVSVDIGSTTRDFTSIPGAEEYTISTRPISDLVRRIEIEEGALQEKLNSDELSDGAHVVVVGAGAAGIELSLGMRARWNKLLDSKLSITLIDSSAELMPSESPACRAALKNVMAKYNIEVRHNLVVDEVTSSHVHVSTNNQDGESTKEQLPYTHCIWATGAEAHTLAWDLHEQCGLSVSPDRGWIRVNENMQSLSHPSVFAAGDCCEIVNRDRKSPPKAGVYAVRSGPILIENLIRYLGATNHSKTEDGLSNNELIAYQPQTDFLKLLMCGDGTALGFRFGIPLYGNWVWQLKNHIDVMFMDLFDVDKLPKYDNTEAEEKEEYDTKQYYSYDAKKERIAAEDAGALLLRTDDDVEYKVAWSILREMMADEEYKEEVLRLLQPPLAALSA